MTRLILTRLSAKCDDPFDSKLPFFLDPDKVSDRRVLGAVTKNLLRKYGYDEKEKEREAPESSGSAAGKGRKRVGTKRCWKRRWDVHERMEQVAKAGYDGGEEGSDKRWERRPKYTFPPALMFEFDVCFGDPLDVVTRVVEQFFGC